MKTVRQVMQKEKAKRCLVVKKGARYLCNRNEELGLTSKQLEALAFKTELEIRRFIEWATIDTRNSRVVGSSYGIVPLTQPR